MQSLLCKHCQVVNPLTFHCLGYIGEQIERSLWRVTLAVTNALRSLEILAFGEARSIRVTRGVTSRRVQGQYSVARAITVRGQPGE